MMLVIVSRVMGVGACHPSDRFKLDLYAVMFLQGVLEPSYCWHV